MIELTALKILMEKDNVTVQEVQQVVAERGYYSLDTPVSNYDPDFIACVLIGAWPQVLNAIKH